MALLEKHDLARYRQFVADIEMPDAQKDELIGIVADIMAHFVDAAFGERPSKLRSNKGKIVLPRAARLVINSRK